MWPRLLLVVLLCACGDDDGGADAPPGGADAPAGGDAAGTVDARLDAAAGSPLGEPCATGPECVSGMCTNLLNMAGSTYCSAECNAAATDCPEGGVCWVPGDFTGVCVRSCLAGGGCPGDLSCEIVGTGAAYGCVP